MSDPYFANVSLLLHMDGSNGSTTFTDHSPSPKTVTANSATISTAQSQFGGASGYFGAPGYLTVPGSAAFDFGSGAFTVEFFYYYTSDGGFAVLFDTGGQGFAAQFDSDPNNLIFVVNTTPQFSAAHGMNTNAWNHLAWVRNASNTGRIFVNGTQIGSVGSLGAHNNSSTVYIGSYSGGGYNIAGYLDDLRVTKGVARYSGTFTPPAAPFPNGGPFPTEGRLLRPVAPLLHPPLFT